MPGQGDISAALLDQKMRNYVPGGKRLASVKYLRWILTFFDMMI